MSNDPRGRRLALTDRELLDVIREFRATDWSAITLVHDELEIRIAKRHPGETVQWDETAMYAPRRAATPPPAPGVHVVAPAARPAYVEPTHSETDSGAPASDAIAGGTAVVEAATVGTFWVAPAPGADPFVKPGDAVEAGQQLAIVEVMKLMTEVVAEHAGTVDAVLAENGQSVEAGQPLFRIRVNPSVSGA